MVDGPVYWAGRAVLDISKDTIELCNDGEEDDDGEGGDGGV